MSNQKESNSGRWYPNSNQIKTPEQMLTTLRQVLNQHYALTDQVNALSKQTADPSAKPSGPPPGCGPADSQICGLRVAPVDTKALANGATLKFNKNSGNFEFV
jgi:hypothetical protein